MPRSISREDRWPVPGALSPAVRLRQGTPFEEEHPPFDHTRQWTVHSWRSIVNILREIGSLLREYWCVPGPTGSSPGGTCSGSWLLAEMEEGEPLESPPEEVLRHLVILRIP